MASNTKNAIKRSDHACEKENETVEYQPIYGKNETISKFAKCLKCKQTVAIN